MTGEATPSCCSALLSCTQLCIIVQVREALITAALLTLPQSVPYRTKAAAVDQILQELVGCSVLPWVQLGSKLCPGSHTGPLAGVGSDKF